MDRDDDGHDECASLVGVARVVRVPNLLPPLGGLVNVPTFLVSAAHGPRWKEETVRIGIEIPDRAVLDALPTAVVVSAGGRVRYANHRAAKVLGASVTELVGQPLGDVMGVPDPGLPAADGERGEGRVIRTVGGEERTLGYTSTPVGGAAEVIVFQDITRFINIQRERDKLLRLAAIGEALPSLLHELKNPLAAIMTSVEVLLEEVSAGPVQEDLHAVLSELRRMALSFEGIGAVHRKLRAKRLGPVDYACREACRVLETRAKNAGVEFKYVVDDMPLLPIDPSVVRALVFNFITNAIHACERGSAVRLAAGFNEATGVCELSVVDTGSGMSPDVLDKATDLFFTTKVSGSGIGLALCRRVVEEAGGELTIKSVPGFGTQVRIAVPISG